MRRLLLALAGLAFIGAAGFLIATDPAFFRLLKGSSPVAPSGAADLANGRTMFFAGGCASCHATPGQSDRLKLGGGLPMHTPFGTFYVPNLSPHPRDGIGGWTPDQFIIAMREGVAPDGSHYYPAFPYTSFQRMGGKDLADLFAYIKSLAPVEGRAPAHEIGFPFSIRRSLGGWKLLHLDGQLQQTVAGKSAEWNRGAYLVEGPAIARNAIRRAIRSAASSRRSASVAGRIPRARARCRTSRPTRMALAPGPSRSTRCS